MKTNLDQDSASAVLTVVGTLTVQHTVRLRGFDLSLGTVSILDPSVFKVMVHGFSTSPNKQMSLFLLCPAELNFFLPSLTFQISFTNIWSLLVLHSCFLLSQRLLLLQLLSTVNSVHSLGFSSFHHVFMWKSLMIVLFKCVFYVDCSFCVAYSFLFWNFRICIFVWSSFVSFWRPNIWQVPSICMSVSPTHLILLLLFQYSYAKPNYTESYFILIRRSEIIFYYGCILTSLFTFLGMICNVTESGKRVMIFLSSSRLLIVFTEKPDPPSGLELTDQTERTVQLTWLPGDEHNSPIQSRKCSACSKTGNFLKCLYNKEVFILEQIILL